MYESSDTGVADLRAALMAAAVRGSTGVRGGEVEGLAEVMPAYLRCQQGRGRTNTSVGANIHEQIRLEPTRGAGKTRHTHFHITENFPFME